MKLIQEATINYGEIRFFFLSYEIIMIDFVKVY